MSHLPSDAVRTAPALPSTAELLARRVRYVSLAMVGSLTISTCASYVAGAEITALATAIVVAIAGLVWWLDRLGRVPVRHAGATIWVLWTSVVCVAFVATREVPSWAVDQWLAILFIAYAGVQLERRFVWLAYVPGTIAWALVVIVGVQDPSVFRIVTIAGAVGLSALAFLAQVAFVSETERLRQRDLDHERALAAALRRAQNELEERTRAREEAEQMRRRLEVSQRMQAIGTLAGGVAHELNNVLAGIMGIASLLQDELTGSAQEDVASIVASCHRGADLTSALLVFGHRKAAVVAPVRIASILDEIEPILRRACPVGATLEIDRGPPGLAAAVSRSELAQAIVNLVFNAYHACPDGRVTVAVEGPLGADDTPLDREALRMTVRDEGRGMDAVTRERAFEPFFTTKAPGEGTGLGLAQVYGAVTAVEGLVEATSELGHGTTMNVWLPRCDAPPDSPERAPRQSQSTLRAALVVDDEPLVRRATQMTLGRAGYEVHLAGSADEAEAVADAHDGRFDVAVLDLRMPGRDGVQLATALRARWPNLRIVLYSGDVDADTLKRLEAIGVTEILAKPLSADAFIAALEGA